MSWSYIRTLAGIAVCALSGSACLSVEGFVCTSNDECAFEGMSGTCHVDGRCSLPDPSCASGQRYASEGKSNTEACVPPVEDAGAVEDARPPDVPNAEDVGVDAGFVDAEPEDTGDPDGGMPDSGDAGNPPACNLTHLAAGGQSVCSVRDDTQAYCWGDNEEGELGYGLYGGTSIEPRPVLEGLPFLVMSGVREVHVGTAHSCMLMLDGRVLCSGLNENGRLGRSGQEIFDNGGWQVLQTDGAPIDDATMLDVGYELSCAVRANDELWCWGDNRRGQLGRSSTVASSDFPAPARNAAGNLGSVTGVSIGEDHACGVTPAATYCWGSNDYGQLGDGSFAESDIGVPVVGLTAAPSQISLGRRHSCALIDDGVWCWGRNSAGQLGYGSFDMDRSSTPLQVVDELGVALSGVTMLDGGLSHSCALKGDGTVWCWGQNSGGALGDGTTDSKAFAIQVVQSGETSLTDATRVSLGDDFSCAERSSDPYLVCWGQNGREQLGQYTASLAAASEPLSVDACRNDCVDDLTEIHAGSSYTCMRKSNGQIFCSGRSANNRYAGGINGGETFRAVAVRDPAGLPLTMTSSLTIGEQHACVLTPTNTLGCWGYTGSDRLGTGGDGTQVESVRTAGGAVLDDVVDYDIWTWHGCAARGDGSLWCWGSNYAGQLGNGTDITSVLAVPSSIANVRGVSVGRSHTCALKSDGTVWCWGQNNLQEVTTASSAAELTPIQVQGLPPNIAQVEVGRAFGCARDDDGGVWCWGNGDRGQLGVPATGSIGIPQRVTLLTEELLVDAEELTVGENHACVLTTSGLARCWGAGDDGQLGDGVRADRSRATVVAGVVNFAQISAGVDFTCGTDANGEPHCWGSNGWSNLGRSYRTGRSDVPITPEYVCR